MHDYSNVAFAFAHPHEYSAMFGTALWQTVADCPGINIIDLGSGPGIATARNAMAFQFLNHPNQPDWFLMCDADMSFPPGTVARMLDYADVDDTPILGGLCFVVGRLGRIEPTLKVWDADGKELRTIAKYPEDELVAIDATGAAFLMIHRRVFDTLLEQFKDHPYPFFAESVHDGIQFGEDVTFCIRARQAGFEIKVHTGIEIGHVKPYVYGSYDFKQYLAQVEMMGEDEYQAQYAIRQGRAVKPSAPALSPFARVTELSRRDRRLQARKLARAR